VKAARTVHKSKALLIDILILVVTWLWKWACLVEARPQAYPHAVTKQPCSSSRIVKDMFRAKTPEALAGAVAIWN
jgi:hypothetical protein